jgi:Uma2 family endonuclease
MTVVHLRSKMAGMSPVDPRVSYAELAAWPDDGRRYELYGGEPIVVPAPVNRHQFVVMELVRLLQEHEQAHGGKVIVSPIDIVLSQYDVLQPDVVWFHRDRVHLLGLDDAVHVVPDVAIEVLSRSTEMRDRGRKMQLLARYALPEYWLIDPKRCRIEIYRNESGRFDLAGESGEADEVRSFALAPMRFTAGRLFPYLDSR